MIYINAFIVCGFICLVGQLLVDLFKLTPGHVTSWFVVLGAVLDSFNFYDNLDILYYMVHSQKLKSLV